MDKVIFIVVFHLLTTSLCVSLVEYTLNNGTTCYQSEEAPNQSRCYTFPGSPGNLSMFNWTAANTGCHRINGTFSPVRTQVEFDTVAAIMRREGVADVWLPGYKEKTNWTWIRNGMDLIEANAFWGVTQPSQPLTSDCATTAATTNWEWFWFPCDLTTGFICQKNVDANKGCLNESYFDLEFNTSSACFYLAEEELTFYAARERCVRHNMQLASVDSQEIYDKMVSLDSLSYQFNDLYWIGLTRARWYWAIDETTNEEILETFWASNAPNFLSPGCITMEFVGNKEYKWLNDDCNTHRPYLCEVDTPPSPPESSNSSSSSPQTADSVASSVVPESLSSFIPPDSKNMPVMLSFLEQVQVSGMDTTSEPTSTLAIDESSSTDVFPTTSAKMLSSPSTENASFNVESSEETPSSSTENPSFNVESSGETPSLSSENPSSNVELSLDTPSPSTENPSLSVESRGETPFPSTENPLFNVVSSGETTSEVLSSFQISELDDSYAESISLILAPETTFSVTSLHAESLSPTPVFTVLSTTQPGRIETSELSSSYSMTQSNNVLYSSQLTLSPTEPLTSSIQQVVTSTHQENMKTSPSLIVSSSTQDLHVTSSSLVDSVPQESKFGEISRPLTGLAIAIVTVAGIIVIGTAIGAVIVKRRRARTATAVPQDERTNLRRRFASRIDSRTHDQKSQASTADLRSNEEGQRSPSDLGSLTSSQRSATRVRFQSNRYGPMGGITPTQDFPQTMHYSSWLVRAGYR